MKFVNFIAGFFSEENGKSSNKRIGSLFLLYLIYRQVTAQLTGVDVSLEFFQTIVGLYAVSVGLITAKGAKIPNIKEKFSLNKKTALKNESVTGATLKNESNSHF